MAYTLTPEMASDISDAELAFSATKYLPPENDIPEEFFGNNIYTQLTNSIFYGTELPNAGLVMKEGFEVEAMVKCIRAHLGSFAPGHIHKIAGVAFMMSCMCDITPDVC